MIDSYLRVDKVKYTLPVYEIRVRCVVGIYRYLKRSWELLNGAERSFDPVVIKCASFSIESAVNLAELIKNRVKKIHYINKIALSVSSMNTNLLFKD